MAGKAEYGDKINTPVGRMSYPHVFKKVAQMDPGKDPRYEASLLIPKSTDITAFREALEAVGKRAFGAKWKGLDKLKNPTIRDGDAMDKDQTRGHWVIKASTTKRPAVVGPDKQPIDEDAESGIYGGCWGRYNVTPASYDVSGSWGVTLYLNAIQKARDGERFGGGGVDPDAVFDEFEDSNPEPVSADDNF